MKMKGWDINVTLHNQLIDYGQQLFEQKNYEKIADLGVSFAHIEMRQYTGYLSSIRLEELLLKTGTALFPFSNYKKKEAVPKKVLHIGTEFYNVGGHTRVALDWIKNDLESHSEILLINQTREFNLETAAKIHYLREGSHLEKAEELRSFFTDNYFDVIVLHQHMEDVVPTLALWDIKEKTDSLVLFYNHANFRFSLGNIVAHKRVNITEGDQHISKQFRYPMEDCVLPFVLGDALPEKSEKIIIKSKKELNINDEIVFISIGSAYKYTPYWDQNFFAEWNAFLLENKNCILIVIGCVLKDFESFCPNVEKASNLKLLGLVVNPSEYYQIGDYILDIYPMPTGLGMIQGTFWGLAPILPYAENIIIIGDEMNKLYPKEVRKLLTYSDKESYFSFVENEIETRAYQLKANEILKDHISNNLLSEPWRQQLYNIYDEEPVQVTAFDKNIDVLNMSKASQNWYEFTQSSSGNFGLIILTFRLNIPLTLKVLNFYMNLIMRHGRLSGTGLRVFVRYLLGRYN
ncbi:MAG: hypothetical protein ACI8Q1_001463 [Parvicella sp.]